MAREDNSSWPKLFQSDWMGKREGKLEREKEGERKEGIFRERGSNFSLNFPAIGPSVSSEA